MKTIQTNNGLTLTDVTTDLQYKNGTIAVQLNTLEGPITFLSYSSGYVRRTGNGNRLHYINKRIKNEVQIKSVHTDSNGKTVWERSKGSYITVTPKLIPSMMDRLIYILKFVDRNFTSTVVNKRHSGEIKKIKGLFSDTHYELSKLKGLFSDTQVKRELN